MYWDLSLLSRYLEHFLLGNQSSCWQDIESFYSNCQTYYIGNIFFLKRLNSRVFSIGLLVGHLAMTIEMRTEFHYNWDLAWFPNRSIMNAVNSESYPHERLLTHQTSELAIKRDWQVLIIWDASDPSAAAVLLIRGDFYLIIFTEQRWEATHCWSSRHDGLLTQT